MDSDPNLKNKTKRPKKSVTLVRTRTWAEHTVDDKVDGGVDDGAVPGHVIT